MRYIKFEIENFKGVKNATLDLSKSPKSNVYTLVGLNESGKTTILEAINSFSPDDDGVETLFPDVIRKITPEDLVSKAHKANFTGDISVTAFVQFEEDDKEDLKLYCEKTLRRQIDLSKLPQQFSVARIHQFNESDFLKVTNRWGIRFHLKSSNAKEFREHGSKTKQWSEIINFIGQKMPTICYFPTFLFDFPERIYLNAPPEDTHKQKNDYYVQIIEDVLGSLDEGLNVETHIIERIKRNAEPGIPFDVFNFFKSDYKTQVEHVILRISSQVTKIVLNRWNEIFGVRLKNKTIEVQGSPEPSDDIDKIPYFLEFYIKDGHSLYKISERSLGFRWFFCFLLFTQFRISRKDSGALFLFDEPASNLHPKAQQKLLESFQYISTDNNTIIYTTHSHYMIDPRWLEGAFIVFNDAVDYEDPEDKKAVGSVLDTNIHLQRYRDFVGQNPDGVTYFQPILDRLDYAPSKLEFLDRSVLVEGKEDFYAFYYFKELVFGGKYNLNFMPSSGANELGPMISLYLGWGLSFIILLDADPEGRAAGQRYETEWYLGAGIINTLSDASTKTFKKRKLENLISVAGKKIIAAEIGKKSVSKKEIARNFQEKIAAGETIKFDSETIENFKQVFDYCEAKFS